MEAGIGERTLYDAFGNKEALFHHVADVAIGGDEQPLSVAQQPQFTAALAQRDPARAIAMFADHSAAILERAGPIIMVAVESAGAAPSTAPQPTHRLAVAGPAPVTVNLHDVSRR